MLIWRQIQGHTKKLLILYEYAFKRKCDNFSEALSGTVLIVFLMACHLPHQFLNISLELAATAAKFNMLA
jgi:hypothetical protein